MQRQQPRQAGYDHAWEATRRHKLLLNPQCEVQGCSHKAKHVDHIVPLRVAPWRRLDLTNLQSLCHKHHNIVTAAYDAGTIHGACDSDGFPVDPAHPWNAATNEAAIRAVNAMPPANAGLAARLKRQAVTRRRQ